MFKKLTNLSVKLVEKLLPDAFIFCIILTILTFVLGMISTGQGIVEMSTHWGRGVWSLLGFSMQMALVLVLGNALASSRPVKGFLSKVASIAKTPTHAIMLVSFVSAVACWINWGFGLIVGALLAMELARRVKGVDYRLLIASAYSGFVVWHNGISGSVPLSVASNLEELGRFSNGIITEVIPTSQTIFSPWNLIVSGIIIFTLPIINKLMHPDPDKVIAVNPKLIEVHPEPARKDKKDMTIAEKMENSMILSYIIVAMGIVYLVYYFANNGFNLTLDIVNMIFLVLGIAFHKTPINYVSAVNDAVRGAGGIILQFPFYAGIMGLMTGANAEGLSLAAVVSNWFVNISTVRTFPMFTFWAAGIVNFFVPSGGGQWAVQGPIMIPSSIELGVDVSKTAIAIAAGDAWTNMIQPFWALPALGVAGLSAKDIMGYCLMILLYTGIIFSVAFLFI